MDGNAGADSQPVTGSRPGRNAHGSHVAISGDANGEVATVSLGNSGTMNILGSDAISELTLSFRALARRDGLSAVVLRGAGDRAFSGGADIEEMATLDRRSAEKFIRRLADLCETVRSCPVPVIARLSGWCLGAGLELAMACDLRIAAESAQLGMPEVTVGIPSVIHSALLPAHIGSSRATWLLLTGLTISAERAEQWGLVHEVVPGDQLDPRIGQLTELFTRLGTQVIRQQKRLINSWYHKDVRTAIDDSVEQFGLSFLTGEPQRAMAQFLHRRAGRPNH